MKISVRRLATWTGLILFFLFVFTVDFRISIFRSVYMAYTVAIFAIMLLYYGAKTRFKLLGSVPMVLWYASVVFVVRSLDISYIIKYMMGLLMLYCYQKTSTHYDKTLRVLCVAGVIFASATFVFYFIPEFYTKNIVPYLAEYLQETAGIMMRTSRYPGLTGHYSTNGTYLAIGFGAMISWYLTKLSDKRKARHTILCTLLILGALFLIGKRAHLVFSLASGFAIYWMSNGRNTKSRIAKAVRLVVVIMVLFVIAVNQIPALMNTFNRFVETATGGDFLMSRGVFYAEALAVFKKNPLLGCGWRTMINIIDHDVHNIYIQLLAETGIPGFIFYVGLIVYAVILAVRTLNYFTENRYEIEDCEYGMLCFSAYYVFFFVLYGMTGNPLYDEQPFYIFMIAVGVLLFFRREYEISRRRFE